MRLTCGSPDSANRYWQARRTTAAVVIEAKTWIWEKLRPAMEKDFWSTSKRFWQTTKQLRQGKHGLGWDTEILKALDEFGLFWLTRLFNIAWESGTVPGDWVWWFPFFLSCGGALWEYGVPGPLMYTHPIPIQPCESCICILCSVSSLFPVNWSPPGLSLVTILFVIFMNRFSRYSRGQRVSSLGALGCCSLRMMLS